MLETKVVLFTHCNSVNVFRANESTGMSWVENLSRADLGVVIKLLNAEERQRQCLGTVDSTVSNVNTFCYYGGFEEREKKILDERRRIN